VEGAAAWSMAGDLPYAITAIKGVSINNKVFMTGGIYPKNNNSITMLYSDMFLKFNTITNNWEIVGRTREKKSAHAVSTVPVRDIIDYCTEQE